MTGLPAHLRLCMDGRLLVAGKTGAARYAAGLRATLPLLGARTTLLCDRDGGPIRRGMAALLSRSRPAFLHQGRDGEDRLVGPALFRAAQIHFGLWHRLLPVTTDTRPGIMHWTYPVPMRMAGWINIYTIHDVIPLDTPALAGVDPVRLRAMLNRICAVADRIVTVSEASRARILAQLEIDPARVVNCYQAVEPAARMADPDTPLPGGVSAGGYFLYCGLSEPRKNLPRLIEAHRRSGTTCPLIWVGPGDPLSSDNSTGLVRRVPYVSDAVMAQLTAGARAVLFPSLAEGFGLPVVEAMAADTPVLTSQDGALGEVAGNAALRVDPYDVDGIAAGIARLDREPLLRRDLIALGRIRATRFNRMRFAARLRSVYAAALDEGRDRKGMRA